MYYHLGILYLASVVEKAGFSVDVLDMRDGYKPFPEATFYGFTATTPEIPYAKKLSRTLSGKTILGGAHASLLPKDCIDWFDYIVIGEGEEAILEILRGETSYNIVTGRRIQDLDKIPFPSWDKIDNPFSETLFPGEKYGTGDRAATIITSRGCPFHCAFCSNIYQKPVVHRSVENIVAEIKELINKGIHYFRFEDDNMAIHPDFANLAGELKLLDIHFKCHIRSDLVTPLKAKMLKESGCEECGMGIESADDDVLKLVNKRETLFDHLRGVKILKEAGIRTKVYWVMGLPGETDKTLECNKEFTRYAKPEKWTVSTFTPYPGCDIYKRPEDYGIKIIDYDFAHWWNFCEDLHRYNHIILGQTSEEMWTRYVDFYTFLSGGKWKDS